jgi:hypothetical protein
LRQIFRSPRHTLSLLPIPSSSFFLSSNQVPAKSLISLSLSHSFQPSIAQEEKKKEKRGKMPPKMLALKRLKQINAILT